MATIKSHTTIEQSRILAKILPLETSDMLFQLGEYKYADSIRVPLTKEHWEQMMPDINPCWSLAALLEELNRNFWKVSLKCCGAEWAVTYDDGERYISVSADYAIDACYEMILKLNKLNLL